MFLSLLKINTEPGCRGRKWMRNVYRIHQRLWMAFAEPERKQADEFFLSTWDPPSTRQNATKQRDFLFRLEPDPPARILVQSQTRPDWEWAFQNASGFLLEGGAAVREVRPVLLPRQRYRFRLQANPTKRPSPNPASDVADSPKNTVRPRLPIRDPGQRKQWLERKLDQAAQLLTLAADRPKRLVFKKHESSPKQVTIDVVVFEGLIEVTDPETLLERIVRGIGPAKAFGCGLLSLARA